MTDVLYIWSYCKFSREKTKAVLLFNAMNPMDKIDFVDVHSGDTRVRRADNIFGGREKVLCPSGFVNDDVFNIGVFTMEHEYAFLKKLKR